MPLRSLAVAGALLLGGALSAQSTVVHTFDADPPGSLPSGFAPAAFRQTAPGAWTVAQAGPIRYLSHRADAAQSGWSLALDTANRWDEVVVSVRLRLAAGTRAGGIVWRYEDPRNFRAVLLDLTRREIAAYRVVGGNRFWIDVEDELELDPEAWHTVKLVQEDDRITVSLGGIRVFRDQDRRGDRTHEGLVGVLAAGDAEVWFDDLRVAPRRSR